jgi:coenzyme Q-binding protein COQ10
VPFNADQIFQVIADVASYQEFVPLVQASTVFGRQAAANGDDHFNAELRVAYPALRINEQFSSAVEACPTAFTVKTESRGNAIKHLLSQWRVTPVGEASSDISFNVDYEMRNVILQLAMGRVFDQAVQKIMTAFERRALSLYGK